MIIGKLYICTVETFLVSADYVGTKISYIHTNDIVLPVQMFANGFYKCLYKNKVIYTFNVAEALKEIR